MGRAITWLKSGGRAVMDRLLIPERVAEVGTPEPPAALETGGAYRLCTQVKQRPTEKTGTLTSRQLVYPVYLDAPMMASFYAASGLVVEIEKARKEAASKSERGKVEGGFDASFEPLLQLLKLRLQATAGYEREKGSGESVEVKSLFQHTAASLFNILREALLAKEGIREVVGASSDSGAQSLAEGDLVEVTGRIAANPLERLVEAYERLLAYEGVRAGPSTKSRREPRRRWFPFLPGPASSLIDALFDEDRNRPKLARILREDLDAADVRDLVIATRIPNLVAVLVVSPPFFAQSADHLMDGTFTVLGKVTGIKDDTTPLDFMRRTALASMSIPEAKKLVRGLGNDVRRVGGSGHLLADHGETRVPGFQLLPLAIFV